MKFMTRLMRRFSRDTDGSVTAEAVIVMPMLIWAYLALFVYWDVFRSYNTVQKASYTISDLISRQSEVDNKFLDGMLTIMNYLIDSDQNSKMRLTSVQWIEKDQKYVVLWSRSPGRGMTALTNSTVQAFKSRIPEMADGNSVIMVETEVSYVPAFDAGIAPRTFSEFVVTRPRNGALRICLKSGCPI
ncbi:MAG: pilus assembly protein [Pseudomonadota bacterium]